MKASRLAGLAICVAIASASLLTCGTPKPVCTSKSCLLGCCDASGLCQVGSLPQVCGSNGAACVACTSTQICQLGYCVNSSNCKATGVSCVTAGECCANSCTGGFCGSGTTLPCSATCSGCCTGSGACVSGSDLAICGKGGAQCQTCSGAQQCLGSTPPLFCKDPGCAGCIIAADGGCAGGTSDSACGKWGITCQACGNADTCSSAGVCTGGNCAGCRDSSGFCQTGTLRGACGNDGGLCSSCQTNQVCLNSQCHSPPDAGSGGNDGGCKTSGACVAGVECCSGTCTNYSCGAEGDGGP